MRTRIIIDAAAPTTHARRRTRAIAAVLLLASATMHGHAIAAICTATGTGNWNVPATWSGCGGGVPGAADTARINAVSGTTVVTIPTGVVVTVARIEFGATGSPTLTVDGSLTAGDVVHHGNTINGTGPITVTGTYDWLGSGLLQGFPLPDGSSPVVTFAPGSTWNLSGPAMSCPGVHRAAGQRPLQRREHGLLQCRHLADCSQRHSHLQHCGQHHQPRR